jgi:hypothetical protein
VLALAVPAVAVLLRRMHGHAVGEAAAEQAAADAPATEQPTVAEERP